MRRTTRGARSPGRPARDRPGARPMRRLALLVAACVSLGAVSLRAQDDGGSSTIVATATYTGRVVDELGAPIEGARVALVQPMLTDHFAELDIDVADVEAAPSTVTDAEGRFRFEAASALRDVPAGFSRADVEAAPAAFGYHRMVVSAPGRAAHVLSCSPGSEVVDVGTLALGPGSSIDVRVVDATGRPLTGASLVATERSEWDWERATWRNHADHDGRCTLSHLPQGEYDLWIEATGYASLTRRHVVDDAVLGASTPDAPRTIELRAGGGVRGVVVGETGAPVAGAVIEARRLAALEERVGEFRHAAEATVRGPADLSTTTAVDGSFRLHGLVDEPYELAVERWGFTPRRLRGVTPDGDALEIVLDAHGELVLHLVDEETGAPIPNAKAVVTAVVDDATLSVTSLEPAGHESLHLSGRLKGIEVVPCTPRANDRLVSEGRLPVPTGAVLAGPASTIGHRARLTAPGYVQRHWRIPGVPRGERRDFTLSMLRGALVTGRVTDTEGEPVVGARVFLRRDGTAIGQPGPTDADGRFELAGVPADHWDVRVEALTHRSVRLEIDTRLGETTELDLELVASHDLTGAVRSVSGLSLYGARVAVLWDDGTLRRAESRGGWRDESSWRIARAPVGDATLVATSRFGVAGPLRITTTGERLQREDVTLGRTRVAGILRDPEGRPQPGVQVVLRRPGLPDPLTPLASPDPEETDDLGRFSFEGLVPGRYRFAVRPSNMKDHRRDAPLRLAAGGTEFVVPETDEPKTLDCDLVGRAP